MITNLEKRFMEVSLLELHEIRDSLRDLTLVTKAILNHLLDEKTNKLSN